MRAMLRFAGPMVTGWMICSAASSSAHDLPISNMTIVADEDAIHLEILLNAAELSFFDEVDGDHNGLWDPAEVEAQSEHISQKVVGCFSLEIDGRPVTAAVHGVVPNIGTHHLTIRAHYMGDARELPVRLESHLLAITQRSHVVEVTLHRPDSRHAARLDAHDQEVLFDVERDLAVTAGPSKRPDIRLVRQPAYTMLVGLAALLGSLLFCLGKRR